MLRTGMIISQKALFNKQVHQIRGYQLHWRTYRVYCPIVLIPKIPRFFPLFPKKACFFPFVIRQYDVHLSTRIRWTLILLYFLVR